MPTVYVCTSCKQAFASTQGLMPTASPGYWTGTCQGCVSLARERGSKSKSARKSYFRAEER